MRSNTDQKLRFLIHKRIRQYFLITYKKIHFTGLFLNFHAKFSKEQWALVQRTYGQTEQSLKIRPRTIRALINTYFDNLNIQINFFQFWSIESEWPKWTLNICKPFLLSSLTGDCSLIWFLWDHKIYNQTISTKAHGLEKKLFFR